MSFRTYRHEQPENAPFPMALQNQLEALEQQLSQLLSTMKSMQAENERLRHQQQSLMDECVHLQQKNAAASEQIESILERLRQQAAQQEEDGS